MSESFLQSFRSVPRELSLSDKVTEQITEAIVSKQVRPANGCLRSAIWARDSTSRAPSFVKPCVRWWPAAWCALLPAVAWK